jgi:hypothetical protein
MSQWTWVYIRVALCLFVFVCIVEAGYWPLVYRPSHPPVFHWWQSGWLAEIGLVLGIPLWIATALLSLIVESNPSLEAAGMLLNLGYCFLIFLALGKIKKLKRPK